MIRKTFYAVFITVLVYGCQAISSQEDSLSSPPNYPTFEESEILEDFDALVQELEQKHAGLYQYQAPSSWKKHIAECRAAIQKPMNLKEFYQFIHRLVQPIRCGHTRVRLPDEFLEKYQDAPIFFPLQLKFIDGKVFVLKDCSTRPQFQKGDRLIQINGQNVQEIITQIQEQQAGLADGFNKTGQLRFIERYFASLYALFVMDSGQFEVSYLDSKHQTRQHTQLRGLPYAKVAHALSDQPIRLDLLDDLKTGILKVSTFDPQILEEYQVDFNKIILESFQKLHQSQCKYLILDLRGNLGGDLMNLFGLLSYVMKDYFSMFEKIEQNPHQQVLHSQNPQNISPLFGSFLFSMPATPLESGFRGEVYVLIDGLTFSAASVAAALLKSQQVAILVGEESGGAYLGNNGGVLSGFKLAHSGISVRIPLLRYRNAVRKIPQSSSGVIPDYTIRQNEKDFKEDVDTAMKVVIDMIRKQEGLKNFAD